MSEPRPTLVCMANLDVSPITRELLRSIFRLIEAEPSPAALHRHLPGADAYFAALAVRLDAAALAHADRLRVVATSTAEMAWGLLLAAVGRIPFSHAAAMQGQWARDRFRGHQLSGKTLGILGYGRLGRIVAQYGQAFRMRVIACDVRDFEAPGVTRVNLGELLEQADVLSIHIHLTEENRGLLSRGALARMKRGAVIVNTSRGAILDEAALLEALASGQIGAAGLDVIDGEWRTDLHRHPLIAYAREHENLVISPHTGGVTFEAQDLTLQFTARRLIEWFVRTSPRPLPSP